MAWNGKEKTKTERINILIDEEDKETLQALADEEDLALTELLVSKCLKMKKGL